MARAVAGYWSTCLALFGGRPPGRPGFRRCDERRYRRCAASGRGRDLGGGQHHQLLPAL